MDEEQQRQGMLAWLFGTGKKPAAEVTPAAFQATGQLASAVGTLQIPDDSAEVKRLKAELAKAQAERITSDATHFADKQIGDHRALPAERESIIAAFTQAAQDDSAHGVVTFEGGKTQSRVEQFKAMFAARPAHTLTTELVKTQAGDAAAFAAANRDKTPAAEADKPMTEERRRELLGLTAVGRDVLANDKN